MTREYFDMCDELGQVEIHRRIKLIEATTMDAITFIPAHLGAIRTKVKDLSRQKWKWGLEILEDDNGNKDIRIEDALRIIVPKEHWEAFQEMFSGKLDDDSYLNLKDLLNEAMEDDLEKLRDDLKPVITEMLNEQRFSSLDKTIKVWASRFGVSEFVTNEDKVAIRFENKEKDSQKLSSGLLYVYGEDKGNMEMLIDDIDSGRPLSAHEVFKGYDNIYGTRIKSKFHDIPLIFEAAVDTSFMVSESIYVDSEHVLDEVEKRVSSVKRVGRVLYPSDEKFNTDFFGTLYEVIEDMTK